jgi:hypothetical protein
MAAVSTAERVPTLDSPRSAQRITSVRLFVLSKIALPVDILSVFMLERWGRCLIEFTQLAQVANPVRITGRLTFLPVSRDLSSLM